MREVLSELTAIRDSGGTAAMATVVRTWRSAPRPAGASMLVSDAGEAVGSVSGGCVEGALYEVGIVAAQVFVKHTKPAETSSADSAATGNDSTPP